jgi:hypothetical protein
MKANLIIIFLFVQVLTFSQNNTIEQIDKYVENIENTTDLELSEHDWNKINNVESGRRATLKIWKIKNEIAKVEEELHSSFGILRRIIYVKNNQPIKALETEENFDLQDNEVDNSKLYIKYKLQVYVVSPYTVNQEYEFEVIEEGKRNFNESYCDYESVFGILNRVKNL